MSKHRIEKQRAKKSNKYGERSRADVRRLLKTSFFIPHCRQLQIVQRCISHKCSLMCETSWSHNIQNQSCCFDAFGSTRRKVKKCRRTGSEPADQRNRFRNGSLKCADLQPIRSFNCVTLIIDCYYNELLIAQHTQHLIFHMHEFSQAGEMKTIVKWWRTVDLIRLAQ